MSLKLFQFTMRVSAMTGLSRITGLGRDIAFAQLLGGGMFADAFFIAFRIPNFFRRIFAEGAFSSAFVPVYSEFETKGGDVKAKLFLELVLGRLSLILLAVTVTGVLGAPILVNILAPGFQNDPYKFQTTVTALRYTFPYLFFISLVAMAGGILNTRDRFSIPAITPALLNGCLILSVVFFIPIFENPTVALSVGVLIAGFIQLGFQLPFLHMERRLPLPRIRANLEKDKAPQDGVKKVFTLMLPALFGVSVAQLNLLINTVLASFLVTGSVSWLYYSDRLMEFPLGVFGVALATVTLPALAGHHNKKAFREFSETVDWSLRLACFIAIPASVGLGILAEPLIMVFFQYGEFNVLDTVMTARSLVAFSYGLFALILVKVLAPGFFAVKDTKTPVKAGAIAVIVNIVFSLALIQPFQHVGLALSTSIAAYINAILLFWWLRRRGIYMPKKGWLAYLGRIVLAVLVMGIVLEYFGNHLTNWNEFNTFWRIASIIQWIVIGAGIYLLVLFLTGLRFWKLIRKPTG